MELKFRPLRKDKKSGKIIVASYDQWRKVFNSKLKVVLVLDNYDKSSFVYNHELKQLFFPFENPSEIENTFEYKEGDIKIDLLNGRKWYMATGLDCDGIPAFTNYTTHDIIVSAGMGKYFKPEFINKFNPLTVQTVLNWLECLLVEKGII